jgi:hypothetical protein
MSNNYTRFSFAVRLPAPAAEFAKELDETIAALYDTEVTKEDRRDPMVLIAQRIFDAHDGNDSGCAFQIEDLDKPTKSKDKVLYVFAEESGSPDIVGEILRTTLRKFKIPSPITFEWAEYADNSRPGEFGGGAMVITAKRIRAHNTSRWIDTTLARLTRRKPG